MKWKLAMGWDNLGYEKEGESFDADYLRTSLSLQFFIWKKHSLQILIGPSLELGWITHYVYSMDTVTLTNPDIGQTTGVNLMFPLTFLFPFTEHSRVYLNVAGGLHLRDDHELPYENDHWARFSRPAKLMSYCPFSIGVGYSFAF